MSSQDLGFALDEIPNLSSHSFGLGVDDVAKISSYSFGFEREDVVKYYAKYRPVYPSEIYDKIISYMNKGSLEENGGHGVVVDVGCGSGQHTRALEKYFDSVIGIDSSDAQISEARRLIEAEPNDKIVYRVGTAEDLSSLAGEGTVDLVTSATAAHWFNIERFYEESLRVLKVGGVIAIATYDLPTWGSSEASRAIQELMFGTFRDYYQHGGFPDIDKVYRGLFSKMPPYFEDCVLDCSTKLQFDQSVREILGFLKSFPPYSHYKPVHPEHPDAMDRLFDKLMNIYKTSSIDKKVDAGSSDIWLLLGRKPSEVQH